MKVTGKRLMMKKAQMVDGTEQRQITIAFCSERRCPEPWSRAGQFKQAFVIMRDAYGTKTPSKKSHRTITVLEFSPSMVVRFYISSIPHVT